MEKVRKRIMTGRRKNGRRWSVPRMKIPYDRIAMPRILEKIYPRSIKGEKSSDTSGKKPMPITKMKNHHCNMKSVSGSVIFSVKDLRECMNSSDVAGE